MSDISVSISMLACTTCLSKKGPWRLIHVGKLKDNRYNLFRLFYLGYFVASPRRLDLYRKYDCVPFPLNHVRGVWRFV